MTIGTWSGFIPYSETNVDRNVDCRPGNYRLVSKETDNKYYAFYVGKSDTDLNRRLKEHLSPNEPNTCIKNKLNTKSCYFQYVYVTTQKERDDIERDDIAKYNPACNSQ